MVVCEMCGRPAECKHHWLFGTFARKLADHDKIYGYLCNDCHNMARNVQDRIHGNSAAEKLSKMLGQAIWELNHVATEEQKEQARAAFMKRYGKSYL